MQTEAKLRVYKCPSCAGAVRYDADAGALLCRWCGNVYAAGELEAEEVDAQLHGYACPECGAELMMDDFMASLTCPYCGNSEVAPRKFSGEFKPDYLIPFKLTKRRAMQCYESMLAEKDYLPDDYGSQSRVVSVQGTYVPFWLHEGTVDFDFTWYCDDGGGKYVQTCHQRRAGSYGYARVPADGSEHMRDDMMDSVEPFDYAELVPYAADYLPGFLAERFSVGSDEVAERIDRRVKNSALHAAEETIEAKWRHRWVDDKRSRATVAHEGCELALLPVWLIVVRYNDEKYLVGVNGQTGKVAVNLPIDSGKQAKTTRKATVSDILMTLSVFAFIAVVVGVIGFVQGDFGGEVNWSALGAGDIAFIVVVGLLLVIMLVAFAAGAYITSKRKVRDSMENVAEAADADEFIQDGSLHVTLSDKKKGPKLESDRWPSR